MPSARRTPRLQVRFGVAAVAFLVISSVTNAAFATAPLDTDRARPQLTNANVECLRYSLVLAGNPLEVLMMTAIAVMSLIIVWPYAGPKGQEPALWEHKQRYAWSEASIERVRAERTVESRGRIPEEVRQAAEVL